MASKWIPLTKNQIDFLIAKHKEDKDHKFLIKRLEETKTPIKIPSAKSKGRNLQKKVCEDIASLLNIEYNQSDDLCLIHSREMGQSGVDIILRGDTLFEFPFSIECKSSESFNLAKTIEQAKANKRSGTDWMVVHKRKSFSSPVVMLDWSVFLSIMKKVIGK